MSAETASALEGALITLADGLDRVEYALRTVERHAPHLLQDEDRQAGAAYRRLSARVRDEVRYLDAGVVP